MLVGKMCGVTTALVFNLLFCLCLTDRDFLRARQRSLLYRLRYISLPMRDCCIRNATKQTAVQNLATQMFLFFGFVSLFLLQFRKSVDVAQEQVCY